MTAPPTAARIDLGRFTFDALYFCATPVESLRGPALLAAVNDWYMGFVRTGWAVPLSFVLDVGALLLSPSTGLRDRWKGATVRPDLRALTLRYHTTLQRLRRHAVFERAAERVRSADPQRRDRAVMTVLKLLLTGLGELKDVYSFNTRDLVLHAGTMAPTGMRGLRMSLAGRKIEGNFVLKSASAVNPRNEFAALMEIIDALCGYFETHDTAKLISREGLLVLELAAHSPAGPARVDYRFLQELLGGTGLRDENPLEVKPPPIEDVVPLNSYQTDGDVGGYVDVNRKTFADVGQLLPSELSLWHSRVSFLHRLLNEGALHYVRENFEYVDRRLRLLFCFVVDAHPGMFDAPGDAHPTFGRGTTPYLRARVLAALLVQDLARLLPREDVRVDCAFYLQTAGGRPGTMPRAEIDLLAWPPREAADRFLFTAGLIRQMPALFQGTPSDADALDALDPDPVSFVTNRCRRKRYHGRHFVFLTSARTWERSLPTDDPGLLALPHNGDSVWVVDCDPARVTVGIVTPRTLPAAAGELRGGVLRQLGDGQVREQFIRTVAAKATGKFESADPSDDRLVELT